MSTESDPGKTADEVSGRKLIGKTSIVSGMTLLSRILGLARDIVFGRYFRRRPSSWTRSSSRTESPTCCAGSSAKGAFSLGFIPVMARYRERHTHAEAREFIDADGGHLCHRIDSSLRRSVWLPRRWSS